MIKKMNNYVISGTLINTDKGKVAIEKIVANPKDYKIRALNRIFEFLTYEKIEECSVVHTDSIYKITTKNDTVLEATGDHCLYTHNGFKYVKNLKEGDLLESLKEGAGIETYSFYTKVKSLEFRIAEEYVYDIQIAKQYYFVANNILVHKRVR
jgi:intein/homing endonuclease